MKTPLNLLLTSVFLLTACGGGAERPQPLVSPAVKTSQPVRTDGVTFKVDRPVSLQDDLSNLAAFESRLNNYVVTIQIPNALAQGLQIKKLHKNKFAYQVIDESSIHYGADRVTVTDEIDLSDVNLAAQSFEYQMENQSQTLQPINISIKPDLIITESKNLSELALTDVKLEIGVLLIEINSKLVTEGNALSIDAETVIASQNASIETMTEEVAVQAAARGQTGRSGGQLKIKTNQLIGDLTIFMRGQKGGQGMDGIAITEIPPQAASGEPSSESTMCRWDNLLIDGVGERIRPEPCFKYCPAQAKDGHPGAKGFPGNAGNPGAPGGASGLVEFVATKTANKVTVKLLPGAGGEPGIGSAGGTGGAGGAPGAVRNPHCRRDAVPGPQGPQGDNGANGAPGIAGEQQLPTITLNGKTE